MEIHDFFLSIFMDSRKNIKPYLCFDGEFFVFMGNLKRG